MDYIDEAIANPGTKIPIKSPNGMQFDKRTFTTSGLFYVQVVDHYKQSIMFNQTTRHVDFAGPIKTVPKKQFMWFLVFSLIVLVFLVLVNTTSVFTFGWLFCGAIWCLIVMSANVAVGQGLFWIGALMIILAFRGIDKIDDEAHRVEFDSSGSILSYIFWAISFLFIYL